MASRGARALALVVLAATLAACALPRPGPSKSEIFAGSVERQGDAFIVAVNDRVTRATAVVPALGFSDALRRAGRLGSDTINPGDLLTLTIYENVTEGLLVGEATNVAVLDEVQVDGQGFIFVPYAGRIRAAGRSPEQLRQDITGALDAQTPDPQVAVRRVAGDGSTVSVMGAVGAQGVYPIQRPNRTLTAMLATAGGVALAPEVAQVSLTRGKTRDRAWLIDLYDNPTLDIALRDGDRILVQQDTRSFTVLGATGTQNRVSFESQTISAIEALAQVGGLSAVTADPTGVFIFRNEPAEIANAVLGRNDLVGDQRFAYVLDLTAPTGMFNARDFVIRDGDTVYVTEAPAVQWQRTIGTLTGTLSAADATTSLAE
ncbi:polysaccharide biosynthesis/export family protein [Alkalilacustris brevis]|uniref:polysaccharide biosynthesis/export family protein n=1 Tax=Alkalilacustris brevis TaxID=2026338 RepID=UPI000E0DB8DE|nr:polysaccharide biosynthesis/export family protein [Alkalilacustris brevis]